MIRHGQIAVRAPRKGLCSIDGAVADWLAAGPSAGAGVLHLFIRHTSASLLVQENADPSARQDLEEFLDRLAPEGQSWHRHLDEGPDDTTAHMRAAVLPTSLAVPVRAGRIDIGRWQGIFLVEHRADQRTREIALTLIAE